MTVEKGNFMKKSVAVVAGALMAASFAAPAFADAEAEGQAVGSPGVVSGNVIQVPVEIALNLCGNTINVIGALNPAIGNVCVIN
ncbi:chaplin [Streptomyces sp. UH6]|uniref:chaplin n=1 Tax=Streptomyces sp. UH6 TaxID=2748379 RepID=UPI0027D2AFFF|nr:chaplin [Streptomyces sp. UH6]